MDDLVNTVKQHLDSIEGVTKVVVAYSGGVDSHVLLHACSILRQQLKSLFFSAVYIDHGLHDDSVHWSEHCKKITTELGFPFHSIQVNAQDKHGDGPEQAARVARYAALSTFIDKHSVLLTAQHEDDQAETLMLQLLRGAGVDGLASMPSFNQFNAGFISRPLLRVSKQHILHYAKNKSLKWVEDSSNYDVSYDRNFLRQEVIPLIQSRWPAFSKTTARSASHCAEASKVLAELSKELLSDSVGHELSIQLLAGNKEETQRLMIREWLKTQGVRLPSKKILQQIQSMLKIDSNKPTLIAWADHQVRLFDNRLFYTPKTEQLILHKVKWCGEVLTLPNLLGILTRTTAVGEGIDKALWDSSTTSVRYRLGGERIKLAKRSGSKALKKLLNEEKIFPWVRDSIPLIYLDNHLVAVANLWLDERFLAKEGEQGYVIEWDHPDWRIK